MLPIHPGHSSIRESDVSDWHILAAPFRSLMYNYDAVAGQEMTRWKKSVTEILGRPE